MPLPPPLSASRTDSGVRAGVASAASVALPLIVIALGMGVATWSVVQYRFEIVATYAVLLLLLIGWLALDRIAPVALSRASLPPTPVTAAAGLAAGLVLVAVIHLKVRPYTYLTASQGWTVRWIFAVTAVLAAGLIVAAALGRIPPSVALAVGIVGYLIAAVLLIHWDARPKIDVWVTLQQAADGIAHGKNIYSLNWHDSPGVQDAFTYLPFMALLLAPGRWLAGDVRWMLVLLTVVGAILVHLLGRPHRAGAEPARGADGSIEATSLGVAPILATGAAIMLLVLPGTPTQVEQAWTEPLLMTCLAGWALGVHRQDDDRRWGWLAVLCVALGLASKQHLVLLLPMFAVWPRFGWRRTAIAAVLAGVFVLPWFLTAPADMIHDTVTVLIDFQPLRFADTLFIAAMHELDWTPPFWITGALVIGVVAGSALLIRGRRAGSGAAAVPELGTVLRWAALVLFVANLVNKQAFYNQYWLVAALVVMSLAVPRTPAPRTVDTPPSAELRPATR